MANADLPRGFRPHGDILHIGIYIAASTVYPGDAVKFEAGASSTTRFRAQVEAGSDTGAICGVALNYAIAGQVVHVCDDPSQFFVGQCDESDFDSNADLNLNTNILATSGDTTYKCSRMELDSSDLQTTGTLQVKVLGYPARQDGKNQMGANAEVIFKINNHQLGSHTGTDGV